jgi:O-antigen/teichoic acid export membrane protein
MPNQLDQKRIVKNTLALYFRQIVTMCIALYTSRIVLRELGVTDFGINALVGGLVAICTVISTALVSALNRHFAFELGKGNYEKLNKLFNVALLIYIVFAFISLILAETVGLWFLLNKMVVPPDRVNSAFWVYEFSVVQMCLSLILTPYMSIVISREKFKFFAYMSIFDAIMKLAVAYSLVVIDFDKLKLFSVLNFSVSIMGFIIYRIYCISNFKETALKFCNEKYLYKDLLKFSGWMIINPIAGIFRNQGVNICLNLFFGPAINAASGIASRVAEIISSFSENATRAVNPQIIKLYASENFTDMWNLVIRASKMYYLLLFVIALPVIANAEFIFSIWLVNVPDYAVIFAQLFLIRDVIRVFLLAPMQVNNASGNIKVLQVINSIFCICNLPIAILLCYLNFDVVFIFIASVFLELFSSLAGLFVVKIQNGLPVLRFLHELFLPIAKVTILSIIAPLAMHYFLPNETLFSVLNIFACIIFGCGISYCLGLSKNEREKLIGFVKRKFLQNHS